MVRSTRKKKGGLSVSPDLLIKGGKKKRHTKRNLKKKHKTNFKKNRKRKITRKKRKIKKRKRTKKHRQKGGSSLPTLSRSEFAEAYGMTSQSGMPNAMATIHSAQCTNDLYNLVTGVTEVQKALSNVELQRPKTSIFSQQLGRLGDTVKDMLDNAATEAQNTGNAELQAAKDIEDAAQKAEADAQNAEEVAADDLADLYSSAAYTNSNMSLGNQTNFQHAIRDGVMSLDDAFGIVESAQRGPDGYDLQDPWTEWRNAALEAGARGNYEDYGGEEAFNKWIKEGRGGTLERLYETAQEEVAASEAAAAEKAAKKELDKQKAYAQQSSNDNANKAQQAKNDNAQGSPDNQMAPRRRPPEQQAKNDNAQGSPDNQNNQPMK